MFKTNVIILYLPLHIISMCIIRKFVNCIYYYHSANKYIMNRPIITIYNRISVYHIIIQRVYKKKNGLLLK